MFCNGCVYAVAYQFVESEYAELLKQLLKLMFVVSE